MLRLFQPDVLDHLPPHQRRGRGRPRAARGGQVNDVDDDGDGVAALRIEQGEQCVRKVGRSATRRDRRFAERERERRKRGRMNRHSRSTTSSAPGAAERQPRSPARGRNKCTRNVRLDPARCNHFTSSGSSEDGYSRTSTWRSLESKGRRVAPMADQTRALPTARLTSAGARAIGLARDPRLSSRDVLRQRSWYINI